MSNYIFSDSERFAVYVTHGEKCYMCKKAIDLQSMHIDHIIPESLLEKGDELNTILTDFGLSSDFGINSFENWMPSCAPCNLEKSSLVFKPSPIIQIVLQKAINRADKAKVLAEKTVSKKLITRALNTLLRAKDSGELSPEVVEKLKPLVDYQFQERNSDLKGTPIKLTPLYEVLSESNGIINIKGPYGIGGRPSGNQVDNSFNCPNCGTAGAWNGARCVICGEMDDD